MRSFQLLGCLPWVQERLPASWSTELCFVTSGPNLGPALPNWRSKRVCWLQPAGRRTPRHRQAGGEGLRGAVHGASLLPTLPRWPQHRSAQSGFSTALCTRPGPPGLDVTRFSQTGLAEGPWSSHGVHTLTPRGPSGAQEAPPISQLPPLTSREAQIKTYFSDLT